MTNNKAQVLEGAKFSEQAAAIKFAQTDDAWRNVQAMRARRRRRCGSTTHRGACPT